MNKQKMNAYFDLLDASLALLRAHHAVTPCMEICLASGRLDEVKVAMRKAADARSKEV